MTARKSEAWETGPPPEMPPFADVVSIAPEPPKPIAPPLKIWSPAEIWAPLPPPDYVVGGILVRSAVAMICATGSSLKTWALADLAIATATGTPWLGRFPCKLGPTLIVDWESGDYELRRRLQRIAAGRGLVGPVQGVEFITMPSLFFGSSDFPAHMVSLAKERSLIQFDSLAAGSAGADENDARFAHGLNVLKAIATETGCTFVVLHHSRKAQSGPGMVDAREMPRGTGALFAAVDVVLQLTRASDDAFRVEQTKARGGKAVDPFILRVDDVGEGASLVRALDPEAEDAGRMSEPLEQAKARVLRVLAAHHDLQSKNEVFRRAKGTKGTVLEAIDELVERKLIQIVDGCFRLASEVP